MYSLCMHALLLCNELPFFNVFDIHFVTVLNFVRSDVQ